jgi:hypothetical protein
LYPSTATVLSLSCSVCNVVRALKNPHSYVNVLSEVFFNYHNRFITIRGRGVCLHRFCICAVWVLGNYKHINKHFSLSPLKLTWTVYFVHAVNIHRLSDRRPKTAQCWNSSIVKYLKFNCDGFLTLHFCLSYPLIFQLFIFFLCTCLIPWHNDFVCVLSHL